MEMMPSLSASPYSASESGAVTSSGVAVTAAAAGTAENANTAERRIIIACLMTAAPESDLDSFLIAPSAPYDWNE